MLRCRQGCQHQTTPQRMRCGNTPQETRIDSAVLCTELPWLEFHAELPQLKQKKKQKGKPMRQLQIARVSCWIATVEPKEKFSPKKPPANKRPRLILPGCRFLLHMKENTRRDRWQRGFQIWEGHAGKHVDPNAFGMKDVRPSFRTEARLWPGIWPGFDGRWGWTFPREDSAGNKIWPGLSSNAGAFFLFFSKTGVCKEMTLKCKKAAWRCSQEPCKANVWQ